MVCRCAGALGHADGRMAATRCRPIWSISFKVFRERFGSGCGSTATRKRIETEYLDGPFRYMRSTWNFRDVGEGRCEVKFFVDFEFRNFMLQKAFGLVFNEAMQRIVRAFELRAEGAFTVRPEAWLQAGLLSIFGKMKGRWGFRPAIRVVVSPHEPGESEMGIFGTACGICTGPL